MKNSEVMRSIVIPTKYTEYVDMKGYELQLYEVPDNEVTGC